MIYLNPVSFRDKIPVTIVGYAPDIGDIVCQINPSDYVWTRIGHLLADGGTREINDRLAEIMREREDG
jgi:hypothetical protein